MPRTQREVDSRNFRGQTRVAEAVEAPDGTPGFDVEEVQIVDGPEPMEYADAMAFNEEKLVILIHPSPDKHAENPVQVGVNGRMAYIWRGQKTLLPRKYVERLARAQSGHVQQDVTAKEERDFNRLTIVPTQYYPFSVLHDPNPNGAAWLQQITQQA